MKKFQIIFMTFIAALAVTAAGCQEVNDADGDDTEVEEEEVLPTDSSGNVIPPGVIDTQTTNEDSDADGYCFDSEVGFYPCDDGAPPGSGGIDSDGDGLTDPHEISIGTDPNNPDTDGGGVDDGDEVNIDGTDPLDPSDDGNPTGNPGDPICVDEDLQGTNNEEPPRILLVVDKSGSMEDDATGYAGSKWEASRTALNSVVQSLENDVEFGLMLYPDGNSNNDSCNEGSLNVSIGTNSTDDIVSALNNTSPGGGTPTASTLDEARVIMDNAGEEGGTRVIVLATDGGPNCNANLNAQNCVCVNPNGCGNNQLSCLDDVRTVNTAGAVNNNGYPIFVIGIPGSENFTDVLNDLSSAGGTAQAGNTKYYAADDSNALATSLEEITDRVTSCRFDLQGAVTNASGMEVSVDGASVSRDTNRQNGWDLVDEDTIEFFGAACALAADGATISTGYCFTPPG